MTWKCFPHYCPFVTWIHRSLVDSPHKRPVTRTFDISLDISLSKQLDKRSIWDATTVMRRHFNEADRQHRLGFLCFFLEIILWHALWLQYFLIKNIVRVCIKLSGIYLDKNIAHFRGQTKIFLWSGGENSMMMMIAWCNWEIKIVIPDVIFDNNAASTISYGYFVVQECVM